MGTAKATFEKAIARSEYLLRLANGLADHRKRRARGEWKSKFRSLMHWSQTHSIERVDSKDVVLVTRDGGTLARADFGVEALGDLLRASLVMAVSAMDAYFHAKILRYVVPHSRRAEPSERLLNERIQVRDFIAARRKKRPNAALRAAVERNLSYQSLQRTERIADALQLIGIAKFWEDVATRLKRTKEDLCDELCGIVRRRNQIAHEGDLSQGKKTRNRDRSISTQFVQRSMALLKAVVEEAETVINAKVR